MADVRPPRPWGEHDLEEGGEQRIEIGPLRLRIRRRDGEIWLAHAREESPAGSPLEPGEDDAEWTRWAVPEGIRSVRLWPAFPDRALVARPEHSFHLVRGAEVRVYIRVPLSVRIELPGSAPAKLTEVPTVTLSDTWFGDLTDGELTYFLPTTARREIGPEHFAPHLAACPLRLSNSAVDDLEVEKIALRVAHLSLFGHQEELWADETSVRYRSAEEGSDVRVSGKPPREAPDSQLLTPPRIPTERGFRARTFARLLTLPGFGDAT